MARRCDEEDQGFLTIRLSTPSECKGFCEVPTHLRSRKVEWFCERREKSRGVVVDSGRCIAYPRPDERFGNRNQTYVVHRSSIINVIAKDPTGHSWYIGSGLRRDDLSRHWIWEFFESQHATARRSDNQNCILDLWRHLKDFNDPGCHFDYFSLDPEIF